MPPKRIALVGNVNNDLFPICRYLRDRGYDAHLFYRPAFDHFSPKADTYQLDYMQYCHAVGWLAQGFFKAPFDEVREQLAHFDVVMGQGDEAAVLARAGVRLDIYFPYGSDVYKYSQLPHEFTLLQRIGALIRGSRSTATFGEMRHGAPAKFLAAAISTARYVVMNYPEVEHHYRALKPVGHLERLAMPFIYEPEYRRVREGQKVDVHWRSEIDEIRRSHELIVLYHGRQEWKTYLNDYTGKNTHHVILGFAEFLKTHPGVAAALVMVEYGTDVQHSKNLIQSLGIEQSVFWFPQMYRKDLMYIIRQADLCCGEFGQSFLMFGTIIEALLMGRPVMSHREDAKYLGTYAELFPIGNAREPSEIAHVIDQRWRDPARFEEMGTIGRAWVERHVIDEPIERIVEIVEES